MANLTTVDEVLALLASGGGAAYFGEPVTVLEHSLQAALYAHRKNWGPALVAAALLHDVGHLLHSEGEDAAARGLDTRHEELAAEALAAHLPATVLEPIRLHVAAKRYLCRANPSYFAGLSAASVESLALQGGPMTAAEARAFLALPHARQAVSLRHADDVAKVPGLQTPGLHAYRPLIAMLWR